MPLPRDVEAQLRSLAYLGDGERDELSEGIETLVSATLAAVPSLLAVTVSRGHSEQPVTVGIHVDGSVPPTIASTSLRLRLPGHNGASITVYADAPHGLDQLAADLPALLDVHRSEAIMTTDQQLPDAAQMSRLLEVQLADASAVDWALGVLLERGHTLDSGRALLQARATAERTTRPVAARALLGEIGS